MFFIQMVLDQLNRRNKVYTMYIHTCTQGCHCKLLTGSHWPLDVWKVCGDYYLDQYRLSITQQLCTYWTSVVPGYYTIVCVVHVPGTTGTYTKRTQAVHTQQTETVVLCVLYVVYYTCSTYILHVCIQINTYKRRIFLLLFYFYFHRYRVYCTHTCTRVDHVVRSTPGNMYVVYTRVYFTILQD